MKQSSMVLAGLTISILIFTCGDDKDEGRSSVSTPSPREQVIASELTDEVSPSISTQSSREQTIASALKYLDESEPYNSAKKLIPELQWIDIKSNRVYLGFTRRPSDMDLILKGAALKCNQAINFGCHVWAVDARDRPFVPGEGRYYQSVTARYGKIQ